MAKKYQGYYNRESVNAKNTTVKRRGNKLGYDQRGDLETKLAFKNGKLTNKGKNYLKELKGELNADEYDYIENELISYAQNQNADALSLARFKSHLVESKIERMIYNFGTTPEEIAERFGVSVSDVINPNNWDFTNQTFNANGDIIDFVYDYEAYRGFRMEKK